MSALYLLLHSIPLHFTYYAPNTLVVVVVVVIVGETPMEFS